MKQQLTEALAYVDSRSGAANSNEVDTIIAAARLVKRLLPGECPNPMHGRPFSPNAIDVPDHCPDCVDGQVWDEGIVEAVVSAIAQARLSVAVQRPGISSVDEAPILARAVLSAIAQLAEKEEG